MHLDNFLFTYIKTLAGDADLVWEANEITVLPVSLCQLQTGIHSDQFG